MRAAFLTNIRQMQVREVPTPKVTTPTDVLLKVDVLGVCGSDIHYFTEGRIGSMAVEFPWIIGHELGATVVEVGKAVKNVRPGQVVAVDPLIACGKCDQCTSGREHTCRDQVFMGCPGQLAGGLAQYVVMPAKCCYPVPKGVTAEQASLTEPFAIGIHAVRMAGNVKNARIAILGSGPIGLCILLALRAAGADGIVMTDLLDYRLALAARLGAARTLNAAKSDVAADLCRDVPLGFDIVFECAGKNETVDQAVKLLAPGGRMMLVGIPTESRISIDFNDLRRKELSAHCVRRQNECVEEAIEMVADGRVNLDPLVTHHFTLDQSQQAFETVGNYAECVVKAMIAL